MVNGVPQFRAKMRGIVPRLHAALRPVMEADANRIVATMRNLNTHAGIEIDWTWGDAPSGGVGLMSRADGGLKITIYATAKSSEYPNGFPALTWWAEFGTAMRRHKSGKSTGQITASPYFYPGWRLNRDRAKRRIANTVRKVFKETF